MSIPKPDWTKPVEVSLHDIIKCDLYFNWSQETVGFGQLAVSVKLVKEEGNTVMRVTGDTEAMGREWTTKALHALVDAISHAIPERGLNGTPVDVPIPLEVRHHWDKLLEMESGEPQQPAFQAHSTTPKN